MHQGIEGAQGIKELLLLLVHAPPRYLGSVGDVNSIECSSVCSGFSLLIVTMRSYLERKQDATLGSLAAALRYAFAEEDKGILVILSRVDRSFWRSTQRT
jgi:hypothetical protein